MRFNFLVAFIFLGLCSVANAEQLIGISDGDTLTILVNGRPLKIRLANIDAPEKGQALAASSKRSLSEICWDTDVTYQVQGVDRRWMRTVAVVFCGGIEANKEQVRRGMAWVYPKYNEDSSLPEIEAIARKNNLGIWSEPDAVPPWIFRRQTKLMRSRSK